MEKQDKERFCMEMAKVLRAAWIVSTPVDASQEKLDEANETVLFLLDGLKILTMTFEPTEFHPLEKLEDEIYSCMMHE